MEKGRQGRLREMGNISDSLKKASPPPAPTKLCDGAEEKKKRMKAPPTNPLAPKPAEEAKGPTVTISEENSSSEESEECEKMQEGPIDIEQYEYVTGAQIRMQLQSRKKETSSKGTDTLKNREARKRSRSSETRAK